MADRQRSFGMSNACSSRRRHAGPIVATLILLVAGRGVAQLITSGQIITIYYSPYFFHRQRLRPRHPILALRRRRGARRAPLLVRRTALGLFIEAIGSTRWPPASPESAASSITFWVYAVCGLCAGIAGLIVSSNVKSADGNNAGLLLELDAILAVSCGGTSLSAAASRSSAAWWAPHHPDAHHHHLLRRRPARGEPWW